MLYLLDANVLIDAHRDYYPIDRVPQFWDWIICWATNHQIKVPPEICYEIVSGREDRLTKWIKKNKAVVMLDEDVDPVKVEHVLECYGQDLDDSELRTIGKDPFLIAYALEDYPQRLVVTTESYRPKRIGANRHVPNVCADPGVRCCDTFTLIRKLDFRANS